MPDKKYLIEIPDMPESSGVWDADKWERNKDKFMQKYPDANIFEVGQYDPNDMDDNDQFMLSFENDADSSGVWDAAKWERNKEAFMAKYPEAHVDRVRYVDYWGNKAQNDKARLEELQRPDEARNAKLAEMGFYDDLTDGQMDFDLDAPSKIGLKPLSSAIKQNSVSGEITYLDPKVEEFMANDTAHTERQMEMNRLREEYDRNPRVVEQREYEAQMARYAADLEKQIKSDMESEVDVVKAARGASAKHQFGEDMTSDQMGYLLDRIAGDKAGSGAEENEKLERYNSALKLLQQAKDAREVAGKGLGGGIADTAKDWVRNAATQSDIEMYNEIGNILTSLERKVGNLNEVSEEDIENNLSKDEKALIRAFFEYNAAMADAGENMSTWYKGGKIFAESIPFMLEFLATGGLATGAGRAATSWMGKGFAKWIAKSAKGALARTVKKGVAKSVSGVAKTMVAAGARTLAAPSTYKNIAEQSVQYGEDGHLDRGGNMVRAAVDSYIEQLSEMSGAAFGEVLGGIGKLALGKTAFNKIGAWFGNNATMQTLSRLGFHGLPEEVGEEIFGNALRTITGVDNEALSRMFEKDEFASMIIGFAPMTLIGAGTSAAQMGAVSIGAANAGKRMRHDLSRSYTEEQIDQVVMSLDAAKDANQITEAIKPIITSMAAAGAPKHEIQSVWDYAIAVAKKKAMISAQSVQEMQLTEAKIGEVRDAMGERFWIENEDGTRDVKQITLNNGNTAYVVSKPDQDGRVAIINANTGQKGTALPQDIKEESWNGTLNAFGAGLVMADRTLKEQQRMQEERKAQITEVQKRLSVDPRINVGTEGSPINLVVQSFNDAGVRYVTQDGSVGNLSWEQAADSIGMPIVVKTDAQIAQEEADALVAAAAERRSKRAKMDEVGETERNNAVIDAENAVAEGEQIATHIPMNEDGTVNEAAFWEQSPEEYVKWNDEQNKDGGQDSLQQVAIAKQELMGLLQEANAAQNTSNPTTRKAAKKEVERLADRIARLDAIEQSYMQSLEEEKVAVQQTAATPTSSMSEEALESMDAQYQGILGKTRVQSERVRVMQEYLDKLAEDSAPIRVLTAENYEEVMKAEGCSENDIKRVGEALKMGKPIGGFTSNGKLFLMEEGLTNINEARVTYVHERQHVLNTQNSKFAQAIVEAAGGNREMLVEWVKSFVGNEMDVYKSLTLEGLADELICRCMEIAYTSEEFSVDLQSKGIPSEVISIITEIDNEQRSSTSLANARRRGRRNENANVNIEGGVEENGRDSGQVSGGILGNEAIGSSGSSNGGARTGSTGEGAEVISDDEEELNTSDVPESPDDVAEQGTIMNMANQQAEGNIMFRTANGSLVGMHNISEDKLRKALKQGGLANPSTAVVNIAEYLLDGYGEISLIMPSSLVDASTGDNVGTYTGDAWTPTYPPISRKVDDKGWKAIKDLIRSVVSEDSPLYHDIINGLENYLEDNRSSKMEFVFLKEKGIEPEIAYKGADGFVGIRNLEAILGVQGLRDGLESYERYKNASPIAKRSFNMWLDAAGNKQAHRELKEQLKKEPKLADVLKLNEDVSFAAFDSFTYDIFRKEQDAGKIDTYDTMGAAARYVDANNLRGEFEAWLESLMEQAGAKEVFFAGYTRDGDRIYKDNTLENVSRHMRLQGRTNAYDDHGLSATKSALLQRLTSLSQIRKNKARLQNESAYNKEYDALKDRLRSIISQLADMQEISSNQFMNVDYAESRLQESFTKKNPIAHLNKEYGYDIDPAGEYADELKSFIKDVQQMPAKYFETKFERPVYLNEFAAAVMPTTTSEDVKQAVSEAGLPIFEYDSEVEGSRKEATLKATEGEGIRFRTLGEKGAANLDKAEEVTIRLDNLGVARQMEEAGKDAKAIKLATGWERGADNLWRYEVADDFDLTELENRLQENLNDGLSKTWGVLYPSDLGDLTKSYPDFNVDIMVWVGDEFENTGEYSPATEGDETTFGRPASIEVKAKTVADIKDVLVHEIQHAIQEKEGFAEGGSVFGLKDKLSAELDKRVARIKELRAEGRDAEADELMRMSKGLAEAVINNDADTYQNYRKLAGEVEARNISARLGMSEQERRESLLSETEDVAREDQIVLMDGLGVSEMGTNMLRTRITPEQDAAYLKAVEAGDMEAAQRMVNEAAKLAGYDSNSDYQGSLAFNGAAPSGYAYYDTKEERIEAWENGNMEDDQTLGDYKDAGIDISNLGWSLTSPVAQRMGNEYTRESIKNLADAVNSDSRKIKVYRAVDADIEEDSIRNGDWVTPSRAYAEYHIGLQDWKEGRIIEQEVDIDDIWWDGNDINEWGYNDGKGYAYKNTPNNRKLLAPVTYDNNGNIIPLSERFNPENEDIRFRMRGENESAKEFTDSIVKDFKDDYNAVAPIEIVDLNSKEDVARFFNIPAEDITDDDIQFIKNDVEKKDIWAAYHPDLKKIVIFVRDSLTDSKKGELALIHENIHAINGKYPEFLALGEYLWNRVEEGTKEHKYKTAIQKFYPEHKWHDELSAYVVSEHMQNGTLDELRYILDLEHTNILNKILNTSGYGKERKSDRAGFFRNVLRKRSSGKVGRASEKKGGASELTAEERRIIGEYFPEFNKTEEMKASVMEGQVMFRTTAITQEVQDEMDAISATAIVRGNYLKAPNGADTNLTPEQWAMVRTKNFLNWFGDWINDPENASKVVDENGEPMVVYHGTQSKFTAFDVGYKGKNFGFRLSDGFYFSPDETVAESYASFPDELKTGEVKAVFLKIINPFHIKSAKDYREQIKEIVSLAARGNRYQADLVVGMSESELLSQRGYDGVVEKRTNGIPGEIVAFEPNQIKSATDNTGVFSVYNDIRFRTRYDVNINPTEAQKKAGNYKMGHIRLDGYNITIENPKGSVRRGTDSKGNAWENTLNNDYGYIRGTEGVDGDHIDVYLSDNPTEGNVFVVDQVNPETREFDEHKVMYGFNSAEEAREAYLANFSEGWGGLGTITEVSKDEFKKWIESSHRKTKPFSEYKSVRVVGAQSEGEETVSFRFSSSTADEIDIKAMRGISTLRAFNVSFNEMRKIFYDVAEETEKAIMQLRAKQNRTAYENEKLAREEKELRAIHRRIDWWESVNSQLVSTDTEPTSLKDGDFDLEPRTPAEFISKFLTMSMTRVNKQFVDKEGKAGIKKVNKRAGVMLTQDTLRRELGWNEKDWSGFRYILSESEGKSLDEIAEMISEDADAQSIFVGMDVMDIKNEIIDFLQSVRSYVDIRDYIKNERTREAKEERDYLNGLVDATIEQIESSTGMTIDEYNDRIITEELKDIERILSDVETSEIYGKFEDLTDQENEAYQRSLLEETEGGIQEGDQVVPDLGDGAMDSAATENSEPQGDSRGTDTGDVGDRASESGRKGAPAIGRKAKGLVQEPMELSSESAPVDEVVNTGKQKAIKENIAAGDIYSEKIQKLNNSLAKLRSALAAQREYDVNTVKIITGLANELLQIGRLTDMSRGEIKRLLSVIKDATGKEDLSVAVERLMDIMIGNQLRSGKSKVGELMKVKASKVNASGVEVRGSLDVVGQQMMQSLKEGIAPTMTDEQLAENIATEENNLDSDSAVIRKNAENRLAGYYLARQYREDILASEAEEKALRKEIEKAKEQYDAGQMDKTAYKEFVKSCYDAIRENRMQRVTAYEEFANKLAAKLAGSIINAKSLNDAEKARVEQIHHFANSDMQGMPSVQQGSVKSAFWNNPILRFLFKPLATFDQMLRSFAPKSRNGEGYLWKHFMGGWLKATENEYKGVQSAHERLDEKVRSVFPEAKRWSDLFSIEKKMPKMQIKFWDGEKMADFELTQGNLLYIYMVNKMTDGQMKLRKMGITDAAVADIARELDPRLLELADWIQDSFLPSLREKYNAVHERLFGAPMSAIDNYFPIRVLANARTREVDLAVDESSAKPSTITGSIIKRTKNSLALDILGSDAFDVVLEHVEQMEKWAAFAEFNKDLNTLLSYNKFRNRVQNTKGIYGAGVTAWNNFRATAELAAGVYKPAVKSDSIDKMIANIAKGVTGAKISYRVYTALKQFLSAPAFVSDASPVELVKALANPYKAWKWAMENLPLFEKRWKSRQAGDSRLMETDADWQVWKSKIVELAGRYGMTPNAFVDALTVSMGAKAIYETKRAEYLKQGYSLEKAEEKAKRDATVLFNESQQSNEAAFLSTAQVDRTIASIVVTVFRNSSMGYQRMYVDALRNIKHMLKSGYKEESIEYMTKQMVRDGLTEEQAARAAERIYNRSFAKNAVRVATFGFLVQFAWNLGPYMAYLLMGDDDEEKKDMLIDAAVRGFVGGPVEGLAAGQAISSVLGDAIMGEKIDDPTLKLPAASDMEAVFSQLDKDPVRAINDIFNFVIQSGVGVNPQTITDAVVAIVDACNGDLETSKEVALAMMRVLQTPQSQIEKLYMENIDFTAEEALDMSIKEFAERYAKYKVTRNAPLTKWMYDDEREKELEDRYIKTFIKKAEEMQRTHGTAEAQTFFEYYDSEYEEMSETLRDLKKQIKSAAIDEDKEAEQVANKQLDDFLESEEFKRYEQLLPHIKAYEAFKKALKTAKPEERENFASEMIKERNAAVELLNSQKK